jgi:hypothetical protein
VFKKIITWIGIVAAAVLAFILGRGTDRPGVGRADAVADDIGNGIDTARENNNEIKSGIERAEDRAERIEKLIDDTRKNNRDALDSVKRAKNILNSAKSRKN